ncbi:hypothetical protein Taro_046740 [Colocasia esculenta]|uniref:Uncharacterized protein n=1 Tax=Colocasia esculenta TaxID=4460 RepID=A0A843X5Y0_COLES|nr:hypothetical protein [Colocasia esculenta]
MVTGAYEEGDMAVRPGGQVATAVRSRSDHDGILVAICLRTRPIEPSRSQVAADERGEKMSFLWSIHSSPASKSSSTRPQQVALIPLNCHVLRIT